MIFCQLVAKTEISELPNCLLGKATFNSLGSHHQRPQAEASFGRSFDFLTTERVLFSSHPGISTRAC
jgi:hypothetical protein